jgi:hypothetical protein
MRKYLRACLFLLFSLASAAQATTISYSLNALGGNRYSYDYILTATAAEPLEAFNIYFPFHEYANLAPGNLPVGWLAMLTQPDPALYVDGIFSAESINGQIPTGVPTAGFSIEFDWIGSGLPGRQGYNFTDARTGGNVWIGGTVQVPEPGTLGLSLLMLGLIGYRRSLPTIPLGKK